MLTVTNGVTVEQGSVAKFAVGEIKMIDIDQVPASPANVFVQFKPGDKVLPLGNTAEPVKFVEMGILRGAMRATRKPLACTIEVSRGVVKAMAHFDSGVACFMARLEQWERANDSFALLVSQLGSVVEHIERCRLWPRWAALFTLLMMGAAIWL